MISVKQSTTPSPLPPNKKGKIGHHWKYLRQKLLALNIVKQNKRINSLFNIFCMKSISKQLHYWSENFLLRNVVLVNNCERNNPIAESVIQGRGINVWNEYRNTLGNLTNGGMRTSPCDPWINLNFSKCPITRLFVIDRL